MNTDPRRHRDAILALIAAGSLWGLTVPLSKLSLAWLSPSWLAAGRFLWAAPVLAFAGRARLREALTARVALSGAVGYGTVIMLQNVGIEHTSVSDAAIIVGAVPVLVGVFAAGLGQATGGPARWVGYAIALAGVALVAEGGGGGATPRGDLLVLGSAVLSALLISVQPRILAGRDPAAVTAVQFAAAAAVALPIAAISAQPPHAPADYQQVLAFAGLALGGTVLAFWLFAFGQARVSADLAGAFVNLEPVVGAVVGWIGFGNPPTAVQLTGAAAVIIGIVLSATPGAARRTWSRLLDSRPPRWA